ncbi:MAG: CrcB family protein, partial [Alphaproteobacteria bacterium]
FLAGIVASKYPQFKPILLTGFLGGFTTFSAFSLECLNLIQNQQIFAALFYILISVVLSITAACVGCTISV